MSGQEPAERLALLFLRRVLRAAGQRAEQLDEAALRAAWDTLPEAVQTELLCDAVGLLTELRALNLTIRGVEEEVGRGGS